MEDEDRVSFMSILGVGEFRAVWAAEAISETGDQLARVAIAVLVYNRTSSALLTGLTYALSFIPTLVGGLFLSGLADRYPRRSVMVVTDVMRAALLLVMAIPGILLPALWVLLAIVAGVDPVFKSARLATLPTILSGGKLAVGMSIRNTTMYAAQLLGFGGGGALVATLDPSTGLAIDSVTFALSAVLIRLGLGLHRPAGSPAAGPTVARTERMTAVFRLVIRNGRLRTLLAICCLCGFYIAPEGLAAPYAAAIGAGSLGAGLILASDPTGGVIGPIPFFKFVPERVRMRVIGILGVAAGIPLLLCGLQPNLGLTITLLVITGAITVCYTTQAGTAYMQEMPNKIAGQGAGLLTTSMAAAQGIGVLLAGALADLVHPAHAIALAGIAGMVIAAAAAVAWGRVIARPHDKYATETSAWKERP